MGRDRYTDRERVYIEQTLAGRYIDGHGNNPTVRDQLTRVLRAIYSGHTSDPDAIRAIHDILVDFRSRDTLPNEHLQVVGLLARHYSEQSTELRYAGILPHHLWTRAMQSPETCDRLGLRHPRLAIPGSL